MNNDKQNEMLKEERQILAEEKVILKEIRKEEKVLVKTERTIWVLAALISLLVLGAGIGLLFLKISSQSVYTDKVQISAPMINLSSTGGGTLFEVYAHPGDIVLADTVLARVGNELIKTKVNSQVISISGDIGKIFNPGETVITVIDPSALRVVGQVDEDKGLSDIQIGQRAEFTVDTFGSKKYYGVIDEISPTSNQGDIVFNISDKRQVNSFNVKVRFDQTLYPELRNGMSAKLWVYKN
ncbi:MAG: HlyD family efflux transporter periplasmic adaptor subunit [bacterium]